MTPFILNNALHFPNSGHAPALFLEWYARLIIDHPDTQMQVVATPYQPTDENIFFVRISGPYNTNIHLQDCKEYIINNV